MDRPPPPLPPEATPSSRSRTLMEIDFDSLAHCASFLSLRDVARLAVTSKPLCRVAYSDAVWRRLFTDTWPFESLPSGAEGLRERYLARHVALHQLKFSDPVQIFLSQSPIPHSHMLLKNTEVFHAQGSVVTKLNFSDGISQDIRSETLLGHKARITCMRLFPLSDTSLFRSEVQNEDNVLVTSSSDRTIRLWWKGHSQRCFKGHNGPVTTLADKLLGDCGSKVLASGGEDSTVRLWSVASSGKQHPLTMTYHGHEKPVSLLSVARHKDSLLVSMSKDSRVRVWDTTASSSSSSSCVGMTCFSGTPLGMRCFDTLCYVAAGSSVTTIDLRTMRKVSTAAVQLPKLYSFEMLPSKWLICTGGQDKAMLWDIRKNHAKPQSIAELEPGEGPVTMLHMDPYKVVTGGPFDYRVDVWETGTGSLANTLDCRPPGETEAIIGLSAMAVDGCRIVTGGCAEEPGVMYYRDFTNCSIPISSSPDPSSCSKFWEPHHCSDD